MTDNSRKIQQAGMRFTTQMTTSATHELKNKLGIMNENAGLIQDLFYMQSQGRAVDMDRIETISHKIQDQVRLSDAIIKKLNEFVHTMDLSVDESNLVQSIESVLALADRLIAKKRCDIQVLQPKEPILAKANPFYFQNLLWEVIRAICSFETCSGPIRISFGEDTHCPSILFHADGVSEKDFNYLIDSDELGALTQVLKIEPRILEKKGGLGLFWMGSK
ncbi:MAG: hypothetical protein MI892_26795 [Desulfobacterales bacterium]|nr:hypothetical protein [Desulfobacterales bacterium]